MYAIGETRASFAQKRGSFSLRSSSLSARIIKHDIIRLASMHGCVRVRSKNAQVRSRQRHGSATTDCMGATSLGATTHVGELIPGQIENVENQVIINNTMHQLHHTTFERSLLDRISRSQKTCSKMCYICSAKFQCHLGRFSCVFHSKPTHLAQNKCNGSWSNGILDARHRPSIRSHQTSVSSAPCGRERERERDMGTRP